MPNLICEGPCNPTRLATDAEVKDWRRLEMGTYPHGPMTPLPTELRDDLHQLKHTPHQASAYRMHKCSVCGTARIY